MKLSDRERFALQVLVDQAAEDWDSAIEAARIAQEEWRQVWAGNDEKRQMELRMGTNSAIGWGLTLSRMTTRGLVNRLWSGYMWRYVISEAGREAL